MSKYPHYSTQTTPGCSRLFLEDCISWKGPTPEQVMNNCSPWEGPTLDLFLLFPTLSC